MYCALGSISRLWLAGGYLRWYARRLVGYLETGGAYGGFVCRCGWALGVATCTMRLGSAGELGRASGYSGRCGTGVSAYLLVVVGGALPLRLIQSRAC